MTEVGSGLLSLQWWSTFISVLSFFPGSCGPTSAWFLSNAPSAGILPCLLKTLTLLFTCQSFFSRGNGLIVPWCCFSSNWVKFSFKLDGPPGRSSGGGLGNPLQYSCWKNPMNRWAWQSIGHGFTKSQTWLKQLSMHTAGKSATNTWLQG